LEYGGHDRQGHSSRNPVLLALAEEGASGQIQLSCGDGFVAVGGSQGFAELLFFGLRFTKLGGVRSRETFGL
jgi:hypothetical protein